VTTRAVLLVIGSLLTVACDGGAVGPVAIAAGADLCASCRMAVVSTNTAAEIVAPGEEPLIFDEVGCLRDYLARTPLDPEAVAYVADHRTGAWVDARTAVFTKTGTATPMGSGLIAHAGASSRDADPAARGGVPISPDAILRGSAGRTP
jgi:copper chaperone NosL